MKTPIKYLLGVGLLVGATAYTTGAFANSTASDQASSQPDVRNNLYQLGTALQMYAQDNDEMLPPMKDVARTRQLLSDYLKEDSIFINPDDKKPFQINVALSGRALSEIYKQGYDNKQGIIAFYEATPRKNGGRFALMLPTPVEYTKNGDPVWAYPQGYDSFMTPEVQNMTWSQWHMAKKASQIP
jgi:hypothetical protein